MSFYSISDEHDGGKVGARKRRQRDGGKERLRYRDGMRERGHVRERGAVDEERENGKMKRGVCMIFLL